ILAETNYYRVSADLDGKWIKVHFRKQIGPSAWVGLVFSPKEWRSFSELVGWADSQEVSTFKKKAGNWLVHASVDENDSSVYLESGDFQFDFHIGEFGVFSALVGEANTKFLKLDQ